MLCPLAEMGLELPRQPRHRGRLHALVPLIDRASGALGVLPQKEEGGNAGTDAGRLCLGDGGDGQLVSAVDVEDIGAAHTIVFIDIGDPASYPQVGVGVAELTGVVGDLKLRVRSSDALVDL